MANSVTVTASGLVKTGPGIINAVIISSGVAVTVKLWDNTAASGPILLDTTAALTPLLTIPLNAGFVTGLFATITGTTPSVTLLWS